MYKWDTFPSVKNSQNLIKASPGPKLQQKGKKKINSSNHRENGGTVGMGAP